MTRGLRGGTAVVLAVGGLVGALAGCTSPQPAPSPSGTGSEAVMVNADTEWALGGTLMLPQGVPAPYPAVVLVQGSGPSDRDETVYANKPFLDIATYLSTHGIAVLRYDKRTYTYQSKLAADVAGITVEEETIRDAVAAAGLLRADPRIDRNRVYVLGHSEGGMLAPRIDAEGGDFAGLIIMAGSPRTLSDILVDQVTAQVAALSGVAKALGQAQLDALTTALAGLDAMSDDDAKKVSVAGASGYYFKEMNAHPASTYLTALTKPILILQGDKDVQVSPVKDFGAYQTLLAGRANVTFRLYPGLNHLFITSTTGTVEDYKTPGHVDDAVLADVTAWIAAH